MAVSNHSFWIRALTPFKLLYTLSPGKQGLRDLPFIFLQRDLFLLIIFMPKDDENKEYGSSSCRGLLELGAGHMQNRKLVPIPRAQLTVFNLPQPSLHS